MTETQRWNIRLFLLHVALATNDESLTAEDLRAASDDELAAMLEERANCTPKEADSLIERAFREAVEVVISSETKKQ